jgi:hypothetical protein
MRRRDADFIPMLPSAAGGGLGAMLPGAPTAAERPRNVDQAVSTFKARQLIVTWPHQNIRGFGADFDRSGTPNLLRVRRRPPASAGSTSPMSHQTCIAIMS